jgi:ABC-type dipeptide/oligopeptide/nickel transport system permease component
MPNIWFGVLLILFFSVTLAWLPPSGYVPFAENPLGSLQAALRRQGIDVTLSRGKERRIAIARTEGATDE